MENVSSAENMDGENCSETKFKPDLSVSHEAMLLDGNDETFRRVLFLSRLFADRLQLFRDHIAETVGLSGNQYVILLAIAHGQELDRTTVRDVAKYVLMAPTHVTTQVGVLVKKGLVTKSQNSNDARSVLLKLTNKGEGVMRKISPLRQKFNDAFFDGIPRSMLSASEKFLIRVTDNSERALPFLAGKDR